MFYQSQKIFKKIMKPFWQAFKKYTQKREGAKRENSVYKRILIVANRLPITVVEKNNTLEYMESQGGLVSGLKASLKTVKEKMDLECLWLGWPGANVTEANKLKVKDELKNKNSAVPVFLTEQEMDDFYHGFCNKTIWPLFHYFPAYTDFKTENWQVYVEVNKKFAEAILEIIQPDDLVWIHDYHLMLLPMMLRQKGIVNKIGFFLHTPFPFYEIFRILPADCRRQILEGLLGSDLIGFHTHNYSQYFLGCVLRILGLEHTTGQVDLGDRVVQVEAFPLGIDYQKFHEYAKSQENDVAVKKIKDTFPDKKIIISIDRLDYTKGIYKRLQGYECFLEKYPEWQNKIVLMLYIIPSRVAIDSYQQMKKQLDEEIGRINGKFSVLHWTPIVYQFKSIYFEELVALYSAADIGLVTPLRDGMNLIAKEYVACRREQNGMLILSEMAGAAKELGEAVLVNPNNIEEIAESLREALLMSPEEQNKRNYYMQNRLSRYTVQRWTIDFLENLKRNTIRIYKPVKFISSAEQKIILDKYEKSQKRLILLDYDGTLVPFAKDPLLARPNSEINEILNILSNNNRNDLVIISGRDRKVLAKWFVQPEISLVAEHGIWLREKAKEWQLLKNIKQDWKNKVLPILEKYSDSIPGTFVEEKEYSLSWHFRMADPEQYQERRKELLDTLINFTANIDVQVIQGDKVVEVRNTGIDKGTAVALLTSRTNYDFILAIGDDRTDEDMFKEIRENGFAIKVGFSESIAPYRLKSHKEVINFLKELKNI